MTEKIKLDELISDEKEEALRNKLLTSANFSLEEKCRDLTPFRLRDFNHTGYHCKADSYLIQVILLREIAFKNLVDDWRKESTDNRKVSFLLSKIQGMQDYFFYKKLQYAMSKADKILEPKLFGEIFGTRDKCKKCGKFLFKLNENDLKFLFKLNENDFSDNFVCIDCSKEYEK